MSAQRFAEADWYKKASTIYLQTEILYKYLFIFKSRMASNTLVRDLAVRGMK